MKYKSHDYEMNRRYGIRKLTVGVCSVLLSTMLLTATGAKKVKASKKGEEDAVEVVAESPASDLQEAEVAISDNTVVELEATSEAATSDENTQVNEAETNTESASVASSESAASSASSEITETSEIQADDVESSSSVAAAQEVKIDSEALKEVLTQSADATNVQSDATQSTTTTQASSEAIVESSEAEVITPEVYAGEEIRYVLPTQDLTNLASDFVKNAEDLQAAGMTISWENVPSVSKDQIGQEISSKLVISSQTPNESASESGDAITNTQTIDVSFMVEPMATNRTDVDFLESGFYYVATAGKTVDSLECPDDSRYRGIPIYDPENKNSSIIQLNGLNKDTLQVNFAKEVDTSQIGLYYMDIKIVDENPNLVGKNTYILQVPYIVETLKPIDIDEPINALKDQFTRLSTDSWYRITGWGRFFYENYLEYIALGGEAIGYIHSDDNTLEINLYNLDYHRDTFKINWIDENNLTLETNYVFENTPLDTIAPVLKLEDGTLIKASRYRIDPVSSSSTSAVVDYINVVFDDLTDETDITKRPIFFTEESVGLTQAVDDAVLAINPDAQLNYLEHYAPASFKTIRSEIKYVSEVESMLVHLPVGTYANTNILELKSAPEGTTYTLFNSKGEQINEVKVSDEDTTITVKATLPGPLQNSHTYTVTVSPVYAAMATLVPADGNYEKTYDEQPPKFVLTIESFEKELPEGMDKIELDLDYLDFYNYGIPVENPIYAGDYSIFLNSQKIIEEIQNKLGENFKLSILHDFISYTINKAQPENVKITDENGNTVVKSYTGSSISGSDFYLSIDIPGGNTLVRIPLEATHLTIVDQDGKEVQGMPSNTGTYSIKVSSNSSSNEALYAMIEDTYGTEVANSIDLSQFLNEFTVDNAFTITPLQVSDIEVAIPNKTYNGQASSLEGTNVKVSFDSYEVTVSDLASEDYEWADGQAPINAGIYEVKFTDSFYDKLQAAIDEQAGSDNIIIDKESLSDTLVNYTIDKFKPNSANIVFDKFQYFVEGNAIFNPVISLSNGSSTIEVTNIPWSDGDFTFDRDGKYTTSFNKQGDYTLFKVNDSAVKSLKNYDSNNFDWSSLSHLSYIINSYFPTYYIFPAPQDSSVHKVANSTYTIDDFKPANIKAGTTTLDWPEGTQFIFMDEAGNEISELKLADKKAVVQVKIILPDNAKTTLVYKTEVNPIHTATASLAPIEGVSYEKTFDNEVASIPGGAILTITSNGQLPEEMDRIELSADDLVFLDEDGNKIDAPTYAGDYKLGLSVDKVNELRAQLGEGFDLASGDAMIDYTIISAPIEVNVVDSLGANCTATYSSSLPAMYAEVTLPGQESIKIELVKSNNFEFVDGENYGITPSNVGSYNIKVSGGDFGRQLFMTLVSKYGNEFASSIDLSSVKEDFVLENVLTITPYNLSGNILEAYLDVKAKEYDGQAATLTTIGIKPWYKFITTPRYTAVFGEDFVWENDVTPVDAGTYRVQLTDKFYINLQNFFDTELGTGNIKVDPSVRFVSDSYGIFTIEKAKPETAIIGGTIYKLEGDATFAPAIAIESFGNLTGIQWDEQDFEFVDENNNSVSLANMANAGVYTLTSVNSSAESKLQSFTTKNFDLSETSLLYNSLKVIVLSTPQDGSTHKSADKTYTVDDFKPEKMQAGTTELDWPEGTQFIFLNKDGEEITELNLTDDRTVVQVKAILPDNAKAELVYKTQVNPIHSANVVLSPIAGEKYNKVYDTSSVSTDATPQVMISFNVNSGVTIPDGAQNISLTPDKFSFVDDNGDVVTPTNAGSYHIVLNTEGLFAIRMALGNEFEVSYDPAASYVSYEIKQVPAQVDLQQGYEKTFDNTDSVGDIAIKLSFAGFDSDPVKEVTLGSEDYVIIGQNTASLSVGSYDIQLTETGKNRLKDEVTDWAIDASNADYSIFDGDVVIKNAITVKTAQVEEVKFNILETGKTYDGQATAIPKFTIAVSVDGLGLINLPTNADSLIWAAGDAPVNAGEYQLQITDDFLTTVQAFFTDNFGEGNVDVSSGQINGNSTYVIDKAIPTAMISATGNKVYNAQATLDNFNVVLDVQAPGEVPAIQWQDGDFEFTNVATGEKAAAPVEAGPYTVNLTEQGIERIKNINADNLDWSDIEISNSGMTYTITKAPATVEVSGNQTAIYTGSSITPSDFVLNVTTSTGIGNAEGSLLTTNELKVIGDAIEPGSYEVALSDQLIEQLTQTYKNYDLAFTSGMLTIVKNKDVAVTLTGNPQVEYNGQEVTINPNDFVITLANGLNYVLQAGDLQFVTTGNHANAGVYLIELSDQGKQNIAAIDGDHYGYKFENSLASITVMPQQVTAQLVGDQTAPYTKNEALDLTNFSILFGNQVVPVQAGELVIKGYEAGTLPTEAGEYQVLMNKALLERLQAENLNYDLSLSSIENSSATYRITPIEANVTLNGGQTINYGQPAIIELGNYQVELTDEFGNVVDGFILQVGDLEFVSEPDNVGSYTVKLTDSALERISEISTNYSKWNADEIEASFTVETAPLSVVLVGSQTATYTGSPAQIDLSNFSLTILDESIDLSADDLEVNGNPIELGEYDVALTQTALERLSNKYTNYNLSVLPANLSVVRDENVSVTLNGTQETEFTGEEVTIVPSNFTITLANGQTYQLQDGDLQVVSANTVNVGTYIIELSEQGKQNIAQLDSEHYGYKFEDSLATIQVTPKLVSAVVNGKQETSYGQNHAVNPDNFVVSFDGKEIAVKANDLQFKDLPTGVGEYELIASPELLERLKSENPNYDFEAISVDGKYVVVPLAVDVQLEGSQTSTYTRSSAQIDLSNFSLTILDESIGLSADDLQVSGDPVELGEYEVSLTQDALERLSSKYTNYSLSVLPAKLSVVRDENVSVTLNGIQEAEFTGEEVVIDPSQFTVTLANGQIYQLQEGDLQAISTSSVDVGTYAIELSEQGKQNISQLDSEHYGYKFDGQGTLTVVPKPAAVIVVGEQIAAYTRAEELHPENFAITFDGQVFTLQEGELRIEGFEVGELPTEVGEYNVVATEKLFQRLQAENPNYEFVDNSGISLMARIRLGVYIITPITASVQLTGGQTVTYGQDTNIKSENYRVDLVDEFGNVIDGFELTDEDLEFIAIPSDAGNYSVKLTEKALEKIAALGGDNYSEWQAPTEQISAEFEVTKANANLVLEGKDGKVYNGQLSEINLENFTLKFENGEVLDITLEPGDLVFETTPTSAGSYTVVLTEQGLAKVAAKYTNYELAVSEVKGNYEVTKAPVDVEKTEITHDPATGSVTLVVDVNGEKVPINLDSSVLEWVNEAGEKVADLSVPGTYYLKVDPEKAAELGSNFELANEILGKLVVEETDPEEPEIPDAPVVPDTPIVTPPSEEEAGGSDDKAEETVIPNVPTTSTEVGNDENSLPSNPDSIPAKSEEDVSDKEENGISNWEEWAPEGSHEDSGVVKNAQDIVLYKNNHLTRAGRIEVAPKYWAPDGSYQVENMVVSPDGEVISKDGHVTKRGIRILTELPQTSAEGSTKLVALGNLLAGLGLFGLAGTRKKKRKH